MRLSIITTHYSEPEESLNGLFRSIAGQIGCDYKYEVIVVDDGNKDKYLSDSYLNQWSLPIKHIKLEKNVGVGLARQAGIDAASGEYITMFDCDDIFHNACCLHMFNEAVYKNRQMQACCNWLQEGKDQQGNYVYKPMGLSYTWIFGRYFNREHIVNSGVRFHDKLMTSEDTAFVRMMALHLPHQQNPSNSFEYIPQMPFYEYPMYIWRSSEGSITRRNDCEYSVTGFCQYMYCCDIVLTHALSMRPETVPLTAMQTLAYLYASRNNPEWEKDFAKPHLEAADRMLSYMINRWITHTYELPADLQSKVINSVTAGACRSVLTETFSAFNYRLSSWNVKELPDVPIPNMGNNKRGVIEQ